jgi:hypothetical protein
VLCARYSSDENNDQKSCFDYNKSAFSKLQQKNPNNCKIIKFTRINEESLLCIRK